MQTISYRILSINKVTQLSSNKEIFFLLAELIATDKLGSGQEGSLSRTISAKLSFEPSLLNAWAPSDDLRSEDDILLKICFMYARSALEDRLMAGKLQSGRNNQRYRKEQRRSCQLDKRG